MTLPEKYAVLCAVHDVACTDAKPLPQWKERTKENKTLDLGVAYARLKKDVCELTDGQYARVLDVVRDVARDLGEPKPARRQAGRTTIVLQSVAQTMNVSNRQTSVGVNVQRAPADDGKPNGTTPKKPGGRKQIRKRAKRTIPTEREQQAMELRSRRYSFAEIGKELGVSKERARQLVNSGNARQGPQGRSTNLS